jgi:hypothetical protein
MIQAELIICTASSPRSSRLFGGPAAGCTHRVAFTSLAGAEAEYARIAALLDERNKEKGNDGPKTLEVAGDGGYKLTIELNDIASLGLQDYALSNAQQEGLTETYSNLFKHHTKPMPEAKADKPAEKTAE